MIAHQEWLLTPERVAVHVPSGTAVVADLHLGYDEARRRRGEAIPLASLADELASLRAVLMRQGVARVVVAGDLFEERPEPARVVALLAWFSTTGATLEALVPGNHDSGSSAEAGGLPVREEGIEVGGWRVLHGHRRWPSGRLVCGHFHPWLRWGRARVPCYLVGPRAIVLPPYSADARGVDVLPQHRWARYHCCAIVEDDVLDLGELNGLQDRRPARRGRKPS